MKLMIMKPDNIVSIDDRTVSMNLASKEELSGVHAVHWDGFSGQIEYSNGQNETMTVTTLNRFAGVISAFNAQFAEEEAERVNRETLENAREEQEAIVAAQYPQTEIASVREVIGKSGHTLSSSPLTRQSDGALVGIETILDGSSITAVEDAVNLSQAAYSIGIPTFLRMRNTDGDGASLVLSSLDYCRAISSPSVITIVTDWSIELAINRKRAAINSERDVTLNGGFEFAGHSWDSDAVSRGNLKDAVSIITSGFELPTGFVWKTKDNVEVPMTAELLLQLNAAASAHVFETYKESWRRKDLLNALDVETATYQQIEEI